MVCYWLIRIETSLLTSFATAKSLLPSPVKYPRPQRYMR
jgi:hypothetical protein